MEQKRIADYGIKVGELPRGMRNKITDVPGVRVGHVTIDTAEHKTGVTVVMPTPENIFEHKLTAASFVWNGFGKTLGLVQIDELGTLETPIAITNTLNVGLVHDGIVEYMVEACAQDGVEMKSINPVVCECNDCALNQISERAVHQADVFEAIRAASADFEEGDIGAGKGTSCHGLKGGIGSASRLIELDGQTYTLGVLVQSNHGRLKDLIIDHKKVGEQIDAMLQSTTPDKGSIIMIVGTDLPLSDRQLRRVIKRAAVGLARVGSFVGHGSGEVMIGFTTANVVKHSETRDIVPMHILNEGKMDLPFRAVAEATEEAVLNSMITAHTVTGFDGTTKESLTKYLEFL